jgi:PTS system ascorbate-specific IIC component
MDVTEILIYILTQIFSQAAVWYAIVVAIGLVLLRKSASEILVGMLKAIIGYFILWAGVSAVINVVVPIGSWLSTAFKFQGVLSTFSPIAGEGLTKFGIVVGPATLLSFVVNLILARITRIRTVHITAHLILFTCAWMALIASAWQFDVLQLILLVGIFNGFYSWLGTAIAYIPMKTSKRLTKDWTMGVQDFTGTIFVAGVTKAINKIFGGESKPADESEFPKSLEWLRDPSLAIAVFSGVIFFIIGLICGEEVVTASAGGMNWIVYLLLMGAMFQAGILVLLYGVRMLVTQLVEAFKGISEKVIPNSVPGLDYPTVFHFSHIGLLLGFFGYFFGQLVTTLLLILAHSPIVTIPDALPAFFGGALMGVFADAHGGRRGAFLATFIVGIASGLLYAATYPLSGGLFGTGWAWGYTDAYTFGILFYVIAWLFARLLGIPPA